MKDASATRVVLYDGDCGFCTAAVRWLRGRLIGDDARFLAYQNAGDDELQALGLSRADCARRVQVVTPDGAVLSGGDACIELLAGCRGPWPAVAAIGRWYPLAPLVRACYDAFAARRACGQNELRARKEQ